MSSAINSPSFAPFEKRDSSKTMKSTLPVPISPMKNKEKSINFGTERSSTY